MFPVPACIHAALAAAVVGPLAAQAPFAAQVVSYDTRGNLGGGVFQPANALGAPLGGGYGQGGVHVHSLGIGGNLVLQLAMPARNGPGADLLVAENAFAAGDFGRGFAEVAFVEVSSNGQDFARFPARYAGPPVEPGAFGTAAIGDYENLAGATPVLFGSPAYPAADAQDVVEAGGDAFDLADLAGDPQVQAGRVQLGSIAFVRLVDVRSGVDADATGRLIRDCGSGSADIDAVTAIHHQQNAAADGPVVGLTIAADGRFVLSLDDPDGWQDFDGGSLRTSLQGLPVDAAGLLSACVITRADPFGFTLALPVPLPPEIRYRLAVSIKDRAGHRSGAARARP
jgi:hypothetical protein